MEPQASLPQSCVFRTVIDSRDVRSHSGIFRADFRTDHPTHAGWIRVVYGSNASSVHCPSGPLKKHQSFLGRLLEDDSFAVEGQNCCTLPEDGHASVRRYVPGRDVGSAVSAHPRVPAIQADSIPESGLAFASSTDRVVSEHVSTSQLFHEKPSTEDESTPFTRLLQTLTPRGALLPAHSEGQGHVLDDATKDASCPASFSPAFSGASTPVSNPRGISRSFHGEMRGVDLDVSELALDLVSAKIECPEKAEFGTHNGPPQVVEGELQVLERDISKLTRELEMLKAELYARPSRQPTPGVPC